jgi:para-nitrobenzyl esterase
MEDGEAISRLARKLPEAKADAAAALVEAYRVSRRERGLAHGNRALLRALEGDLRFRIPSLRFADLYRERVPETYLYLFTYESPALRGELGACHALELPFVFGTYDAPNQERFAGQGDTVVELSATIRESWTNFAKTGKPTSTRVESWPRYESTRRATLELGAEVLLVDDAYGNERKAWDDVI